MNIHEYQAKALMREYGIGVLRGECAEKPQDIEKVLKKLGGDKWVVKAQIHAGGRGKAGGVKLASNLAEAKDVAQKMFGMNLITHQTGSKGKIVRKVLIEEAVQIDKEFYLGIVLDRSTSRLTIVASSEGGVEIEKVAHDTPEKIYKYPVSPSVGYSSFIGRSIAYGLGLTGNQISSFEKFLQGLYKLYIEKDCSIVEINPLVLTKAGDILALDAKINFDYNALYRHPEIAQLRDLAEESELENQANAAGLSYISLDGNIGCLVNGAGLAMGTMDIIKLHGGEPANFLDVGGGATKETVTKAFSIILTDSKVKAILVNIFGGIMKCDIIAQGVIAAAKELSLKVPLVVRLEGTNVALGKKILSDSGLKIITADNLADAAQKVVRAAHEEE